ncbi:low-density lipoprotein receptor-related protein 12-like [Antedon mediterranea]|uniref:low-density lipoprotein receptor-related protein 12-like n=1 Tax=Antedon mediterranea TaxID=105859 RepID=UPI003AF8F88F
MILSKNTISILLLIASCQLGTLSFNPQVDSAKCGVVQHQGQGRITSPNFPNPYDDNSNCHWKIRADDGHTVTVRFTLMNIESLDGECIDSLKCSYNSTEVVYCGISLPNAITSQFITLTFTSDENNVRNGFSLDFYTSPYPTASCNTQTEFHCKAEKKCIPITWKCNDQYECSDGSDEAPSLCHGLTSVVPATPTECGLHLFSCISAATQQKECFPDIRKCDTVKDCSDGRDEEGCGKCMHYLEDNQGYFISPNFPMNYGNNLDCQWKIIVSEGNTIQLRFVEFELDAMLDTDYIWVYDGGSEYADRFGPYFGAKSIETIPPKVIESTGDRMLITFHSDNVARNSKGFNVTYQTKGNCLSNQLPCPDGSNCYDVDHERCDGEFACSKGHDEMGCFGCTETQIACSKEESRCYTPDRRCDGQASCEHKQDERNCPVDLCNDVKGLFLCDNKHCIFESWKCDLADDCDDNSDERDCPVSNKVITAAVVGSIICGLLLVAALSCTCKLYQLHSGDPYQPSHSTSPMQEIEQQLLWREAPPSYIASMASPHYSRAQQEFLSNIPSQTPCPPPAVNTNSNTETRRTRRPSFFRMLSWDRFAQRRNRERPSSTPNDIGQAQPSSNNESDVIHQQISANRPNPAHANGIQPEDESTANSTEMRPAAPVPLIEPSPSSESGAVSDTDSDTNHEASDRDHMDRRILYAAANLRRIRINGGVQNLYQHTMNLTDPPSQTTLPRSRSDIPSETIDSAEPIHSSVSSDAIINTSQATSSNPVQTHSRAASNGSVISTGSDCTVPLLGRPTRESLC